MQPWGLYVEDPTLEPGQPVWPVSQHPDFRKGALPSCSISQRAFDVWETHGGTLRKLLRRQDLACYTDWLPNLCWHFVEIVQLSRRVARFVYLGRSRPQQGPAPYVAGLSALTTLAHGQHVRSFAHTGRWFTMVDSVFLDLKTIATLKMLECSGSQHLSFAASHLQERSPTSIALLFCNPVLNMSLKSEKVSSLKSEVFFVFVYCRSHWLNCFLEKSTRDSLSHENGTIP